MSLASFLSLFLVVGLGSDVVFVYTDFWHHAERMEDLEGMDSKLLWTLQNAGKASLATTVTTALSFFANLVSVLRPLREFGMFMGLCVVFAWVLITLIFLPLCAVDSYWFSKCACRCGGKEPDIRHESTFRQRSLGEISGCIRRYKGSCLVFVLLLCGIAITFTIINIKTDTGVPNIFPEEHNQNHGQEVLESFEPVDEVMDPVEYEAPRIQAAVCNETRFDAMLDSACALFWCEVRSSHQGPEDKSCHCFQKDLGNTVCAADDQKASTITRFVGPSSIPTAELDDLVGPHLAFKTGLSWATSSPSSSMVRASLASLLLEEWETGETQLKSMMQVTASLNRAQQTPAPSCGFREICFCGSYVCKLPSDWKQVPDIKLPSYVNGVEPAGRLLEAATPVPTYFGPRLLQTATHTVRTDQMASVTVVWGIIANDVAMLLGEPEENERWDFNPSFDLAKPWAQRNIYSFCTNPPADLKVYKTWCWLVDFKNWLEGRSEKFPELEYKFHSQVDLFIRTGLTGQTSSRDFMWLRNDEVKAMYAKFQIDYNRNSQTAPTIALMEKWDDAIEVWNDESSRFARGAWHISDLWVRAQAQEELISSTALTLVVVLVLAFIGMVIFTADVVLSFFVVMATIVVVCLLAFFITTLMNWAIGPIEVIALIVFLGYAVTYSLHIAHRYGEPEALKSPVFLPGVDLSESAHTRYQRTDFAMKAIGGAAIGSAVTTTGCAVFLLFCTLTIFQKLGGVVLAVTVMSITIALGPLPAALMLMGPVNPGMCSKGSCSEKMANMARCLCWCIMTPKDAPRPRSETEASLAAVRNIPNERVMDISGTSQPLSRFAPPPGSSTQKQGQIVPQALAVALAQGGGKSKEVEMDDVRLSEKGFDIGEESPLEPIWARDADRTTMGRGKVNSTRTPKGVSTPADHRPLSASGMGSRHGPGPAEI
jgi:hypothetical protein